MVKEERNLGELGAHRNGEPIAGLALDLKRCRSLWSRIAS